MLRLVVLLLLLGSADVAFATTASSRRFERLAGQLRKQLSEPIAFYLLQQASDLADDLPDPERFVRLARELEKSRRLPEMIRAHLRWQLAQVDLTRGHWERHRLALAELGFADQYWILGPFDNLGNAGFDHANGVEGKRLDISAMHQGVGHRVRWRRVSKLGQFGLAPLGNYFSGGNNVCTYAATAAFVPRAQWAALRVGSADSVKVWVGGQLAWKWAARRESELDQDVSAVYLRRGWNPILLKNCVTSGRLEFYLRITTPAGGKLTGLRYDASPNNLAGDAITWPKRPSRLVLRHPLGEQRARVKSMATHKTPRPAALEKLALARLLLVFHPFDLDGDTRKATTDTALFRQLAADPKQPRDVWFFLDMARAERKDFNARRRALEHALTLAKRPGPGVVYALLALARYQRTRRMPHKALALYRRIRQLDPQQLGAAVAIASEFKALGLPLKGLRMLATLRKTYPKSTLLLLALGRLQLALNDREAAKRSFTTASSLSRIDRESRLHLIHLYREAQQLDPCLAVYDQLGQIYHNDVSLAISRHRLLLGNGKTALAERTLTQLLPIHPTDERLLTELGNTYHHRGHTKRALHYWHLALLYHPQNQQLRNYTEYLQRHQPLESRYGVAIKSLLKTPLSARERKHPAVFLIENQAVRVSENGLSERFRQFAIRILTNEQRDAFASQKFGYVPEQQLFRLLSAEIHKPSGAVEQPTKTYRYRPWGKIGGVYQSLVVQAVTFSNLAVGDVIHIRYRLDDIARENMYGKFYGQFVPFQTSVPKHRQRFVLEHPQGKPIYFYGHRLPNPSRSRRGNWSVLSWDVKGLRAITAEQLMPGFPQVGAYLNLSTYKDWQSLARWYHKLVKDQYQLDDELQLKVRQIVGSQTDERKKIALIHNWVVKNTRYVGIELGIHGFKPYHVTQIYKRGYGDCKDKATLMIAMLRAAGVVADFVMIRTRDRGHLNPYPATLFAFNHAIAYVPKYNLYLDGTAEFSGTAELPHQDQFAMALIMDKDGHGRLVRTPVLKPLSNLVKTTATITLNASGYSRLVGVQTFHGRWATLMRRRFQTESTQRDLLQRAVALKFPGAILESYRVSKLDDLEAPVTISFTTKVPDLIEGGRTRRFESVLISTSLKWYTSVSRREHDIVLRSLIAEDSSVTFILPRGYAPLQPSGQTEIKSRFGRFTHRYQRRGNRLVSTASLRLTQLIIQNNEFKSFRAFCLAVQKALDHQIALVKSN